MNFQANKVFAKLAIRTGALHLLEIQEARREDVLRILDYHRVGTEDSEDGSLDPSLRSVTPEGFEAQMNFLREKYRILSLEDLLAAVRNQTPIPPNSVMVTFDDGYRDFAEHAWPVLKRLEIPAILFLPTGFLSEEGRLFWWDCLYQMVMRTGQTEISIEGIGRWPLESAVQRKAAFEAIKRKFKSMPHETLIRNLNALITTTGVQPETSGKLLTWEEVTQLAREGLYVAPHTRNHPILSRIPLEEVHQEIRQSREDLEEHLDSTWPVFAYPVGGPAELVPDLPEILRTENFEIGMTLIAGHNDLKKDDIFMLNRIGMAPHLSLDEFRLVLTRVYDLYETVRRFWSRQRGP